MSEDSIIPYDCTHEYGNPSGHSLFSAGFFMFLFLDVFHGELKEKKVQVSTLYYYSALFGTISMGFSIGFARLYVAVHSID
jgi:membrane-associated phospholipid phosphatase